MKTKTSELIGPTLDWAIAKCEGYIKETFDDWWPNPYSTDWSQGGPIIDREKIQTVWRILDADGAGYWDASNLFADKYHYRGSTPLVAAMRCYVASKLGDEVEIPDELI